MSTRLLIYDIQNKGLIFDTAQTSPSITTLRIKCHYVIAIIAMLNVIMLSVITLNVLMIGVVAPFHQVTLSSRLSRDSKKEKEKGKRESERDKQRR